MSLRTSAAAAFSRDPIDIDPVPERPTEVDTGTNHATHTTHGDAAATPFEATEKPAEVKTVGNAMRFRPLSVANNKKKPKKKTIPATDTKSSSQDMINNQSTSTPAALPPPKAKKSLFSISQEEATQPKTSTNAAYEPLIEQTSTTDTNIPDPTAFTTQYQTPADPNSLTAIASDLNLSAAERRRLFGRNANNPSAAAIQIQNVNMDAEYAKNEELRAAGETVEHRAVKAIAPGKHSLQQLVNAASTQKEALEDSWAEGRKNRSEGGNKYGWSR